jgi:DNA-binding Lrp family transcriptional regulator
MDEIDKKLLVELASNSSQPIKNLARKLGVTRQTVSFRINRFEKQGIVKGYRARFDYSGLGYTTFFVLFLKIGKFDPPLLSQALDEFRKSAYVMLDASVTGEWDVLLFLGFRSADEYDDFISNLRTKYGEVFRDTKSHAVLRIFKTPDEFVPNP